MKRRNLLGLAAALSMAIARKSAASGHNDFCVMRESGGAFLADKQIIVHGDGYQSHRAEAIAEGRPTSVLVEDDAGYRSVLRDIRRGQLPPGSIAMFDLSRFPEPVIGRLDRSIKGMFVHYSIPRSLEEAKNVHRGISEGRLAANLPYLRTLEESYRALGARRIEQSPGRAAAEVLDATIKQHGPDDLVVLVSHVETFPRWETTPGGEPSRYPAGRLPLVDGSQFLLERVVPNGPTVWIIGCDTWETLKGASDLAQPQLVARGATVTMLYDIPGMTLAAQGRAMEGAARGAVVPVMNLASRIVVEAQVVGPGRVRVANGR